MIDINKEFGKPTPLKDFQIKRIENLNNSFYKLACDIVNNTPNVIEREKALQLLKESKNFAEAAAKISRSIITPEIIANLFSKVERQNTRVVRIWFNIIDYADIRKFGVDILDIVTDTKVLKQGIQGMIWNAEIRIGRNIPEGYAVVVGENQKDYDLKKFSIDGMKWKPLKKNLTRIE